MIDFRGIVEFIKDTISYFITAAIIAFVFIFIIAIVPVVGNSMSPTLNDGDFTIVIRFIYEFKDVERGDIVNIKTNDRLRYVKRVIGLPGENVKYLNGVLYINNVQVSDYVSNDVITNNFTFEDICSNEDCPEAVIPDNMYLVLGDNREDSFDSRDPDLGLISKDEIHGKVIYKVWPLK
jgi:signal peptidase I